MFTKPLTNQIKKHRRGAKSLFSALVLSACLGACSDSGGGSQAYDFSAAASGQISLAGSFNKAAKATSDFLRNFL